MAPPLPAPPALRVPPPSRPRPIGRRDLVSFLVRSARRFTHTDSERASDSDGQDRTNSTAKLQSFVQEMFETNLQTHNNDSKKAMELETILTLTLERLKKNAGQGKNDHSVAGALHNLGCFYASQSNDAAADDDGDDYLSKGMSLCSRALTMRRHLYNDRERTSTTHTPRSPERDE